MAAGGPYWVLISKKKWVLIGSLSQSLGVFISFRDTAFYRFLSQQMLMRFFKSLTKVLQTRVEGGVIVFFKLQNWSVWASPNFGRYRVIFLNWHPPENVS